MQAQQGHKGSGSKLDSTLKTPSVDTPPCSLPTQRAAVRLHAPQTCARARHVLRACRETASGQHPGRRRRPRRRPAAAGRSTPARHQRPPRRPATRPPLPRPGPEPDMCCTLKPAALRCQRRHKHPTHTCKVQAARKPHRRPTHACLVKTWWHCARPPGSYQMMGALCSGAAAQPGSLSWHNAPPASVTMLPMPRCFKNVYP